MCRKMVNCFKSFGLTAQLALIFVTSVESSNNKISPSLLKKLHYSKSSSWNIMIEMSYGSGNPDDDIPSTRSEDQITHFRSKLIDFALRSQTKLMSTVLSPRLSARTISGVEQLWISNEVWVGGANKDLIVLLGSHPDVSFVQEEIIFTLADISLTQEARVMKGTESLPRKVQPFSIAWGVDKVGAPSWWAANNTGQGVILGHIDTGARGSHRILQGNFLGSKIGWYDPEGCTTEPQETSANSHGTHTLGTAVGAEGYGMAPGAKWISCVGCPNGNCKPHLMKMCAEFMLCPNNPRNSTIERCSNTPHVIVNSWGSREGNETTFDNVIAKWRYAGIIPVFAVGNSGPNCGTLGSPSDHRDVIGVGSTNRDDYLSPTSSLGPSPRYQSNQVFKPDLVAPGVGIMSAIGSGDDDFGICSGTSMATPHVAGAIALILFRKPGLSFKQVKNVLTNAAKRDGLTSENGVDCGGVSTGTWPNHKFGSGRLELRGASVPGAGNIQTLVSNLTLVIGLILLMTYRRFS